MRNRRWAWSLILMLAVAGCGQTPNQGETTAETTITADAPAPETTPAAGATDTGAATTPAEAAAADSHAEAETVSAEPDWSTAVDAGITVQKVQGLPEDFFLGADLSSYLVERDSGVCYYDYDGNELDDAGFFRFLHEGGTNLVRIRVWVDPYDQEGRPYGGGNCDLAHAVQLGQLATDAGMRVMIDFHYSDFWADPGKQRAPKAWEGMSLTEEVSALHDYTVDSLTELLSAGVDVAIVQVGNETNNGIAGVDDWSVMPQLFAAGAEAVREVSAAKNHEMLVAVHFANPEHPGNYRQYARALEEGGVPYDVFATSYYPYWHGTLQNLTGILTDIAGKFGKKVMVAETSYVYTFEDGDGGGTTETADKAGDVFPYPAGVQGQADHIRGLAQALMDVGDAAIGLCWWEPAWLPVQVVEGNSDDAQQILTENRAIWEEKGSGWATSYAGDYDESARLYYGGTVVDNEAWFDFRGHPLESARLYSYLRTGAIAPLAVTEVEVAHIVVDYGEDVSQALPERVRVHYNDGTIVEDPVTWDAQEVASLTAAGDYVITGSYEEDAAGQGGTASLNVTIKAQNLLKDGGFEAGPNGQYWTILNDNEDDAVAIQKDSDNVRTGSYCLKFWAPTPFSFTAEQTVTLPRGSYTFGGYLEGGDCGDDARFTLEAQVDGSDAGYLAETSVTGWQNWQNPEITQIVVPADGTKVTLRIGTAAAGGGWGAWDDLYLTADDTQTADH
ncbi:MAG: glycosyl hydrolase 53 family protein [Butyrivibrio sp.]|nr:glycosyl hydrolase 53 family protein [Butyrivibrio sp.]